jgi:hypothetical protein
MRTRPIEDHAATTAVAVLLAVGLTATAGLGIVADTGREPVQAASATQASDDEQAEPLVVDWEGQLDNDACLPSGLHSCRGTSVGEADERHDTGITGSAEDAELELRWEANTPDTDELEISLASAGSCGGSCFTWSTIAETSGTSPLTLTAGDLSIDEGQSLWILVDRPDPTPDPLYADVHTSQDFHVTGEIVPHGGST